MTEQSANNPVPEAGNTDSSKASYAAECEERAARERLKALYRKEKEEKEQAQADYERRLNRVYEGPEKVGRLEGLKNAVTNRLTRWRLFMGERARRRDLSQTEGQAGEKRRQKKNLLLLTILLAAASSLIVWIGTKSRPAKRPEVKVLKSDFRVAPGTLDKQSFQRQYEEKFERMDEDVRALKATIEQLNTRLKREKAKKDSTSMRLVPPIAGTGAETAEVLLNAGKARAKETAPLRLARLKVSDAKPEGKKKSAKPFVRQAVAPRLTEEPLAVNRAYGQASYLPAGSFATAVVLSGVTAPTGAAATSNPVPMLLEITDLARLPNDFAASVNRCFVTADATGDLSSERVWIRLDRLSCMRNDGRAVDVKVRGYVTGEDGKTGVRARVVTRSGQAIANALLLGSLSGFGKALASSASETTTYTSGSVGTVVSNPVRAGLGTAISDATDRIVDYYIRLADKIFPVLELDSGRTVDVVLSQGVRLGEEGTTSDIHLEGPVNSAQVFGKTLQQKRLTGAP